MMFLIVLCQAPSLKWDTLLQKRTPSGAYGWWYEEYNVSLNNNSNTCSLMTKHLFCIIYKDWAGGKVLYPDFYHYFPPKIIVYITMYLNSILLYKEIRYNTIGWKNYVSSLNHLLNEFYPQFMLNWLKLDNYFHYRLFSKWFKIIVY